jgi:beta-glucosidase
MSPLLDLARDIRWGRVHETYGEDPELVARMGIGFIGGVQGDDGDSGMLATGKHFLGYGHSLGALNQAATQLGRRELTDLYAEPFRRAIAEAGLLVMMNSYNEIDGIPASANRWLLTDLLRGELGFGGMVVSDYGSITMLYQTYRTAPTPAHAAAQALTAGIDVELPSAETTSNLRALIDDGTFSESSSTAQSRACSRSRPASACCRTSARHTRRPPRRRKMRNSQANLLAQALPRLSSCSRTTVFYRSFLERRTWRWWVPPPTSFEFTSARTQPSQTAS